MPFYGSGGRSRATGRTMLDRGNRTFICSVVFLDIVEYSKKPVAEQIKLKERFNALIATAIRDVAPADRIILDTGDGAAISFLGDPEEALFVAVSLRDALAGHPPEDPLQVRIGINLGPVRLIKDINGQPNIIGDGINAAQRIMSFAEPGQVLVSRSYYEVISRLSQEYAALFHYEGSRTDKHVRSHEIYALGYPATGALQATRRPEPVAVEGASHPSSPPARAHEAVPSPARRKWLYGIPLAVAGVIGAAFLLRIRREGKPEAVPASAELPAPEPTQEPQPFSERPEQARVLPSARRRPIAREEKSHSDRLAAVQEIAYLGFAISPWGEVFIDGKKQGVSPPLKGIKIPPGRHTVEIRNTTFPAYQETVELQPGETRRIKYKFK